MVYITVPLITHPSGRNRRGGMHVWEGTRGPWEAEPKNRPLALGQGEGCRLPGGSPCESPYAPYGATLLPWARRRDPRTLGCGARKPTRSSLGQGGACLLCAWEGDPKPWDAEPESHTLALGQGEGCCLPRYVIVREQ